MHLFLTLLNYFAACFCTYIAINYHNFEKKPFTPRFVIVIIAALNFVMAGLMAATGVEAQSMCVDRAQIVRGLTNKYGEVQQATGMTENGEILEIWANPEKLTWTTFIVRPSGMACLVAAGKEWNPSISPLGKDL